MTGSPVLAAQERKPASGAATDDQTWFVARWADRSRGLVRDGWLTRALEVAWIVSGALLGAAIALVFRWSPVEAVVLVVVVAALSWWGRGVSTVFVSGAVTLAALALLYRTTMIVWPHQSWSLTWLGPLAVLLVVAGVLVARRLDLARRAEARLTAALVELATGSGALVVSWLCYHRLQGHLAASILVSSEDNDAWLNTVGTLHGAHGVSAATATQVPTFGPVVGLFLSFTRSATGGLIPGKVLPSSTATVVVAAHVLLAVLCPVVAGLLTRRTIGAARPLLSLLTWTTLTGILLAFALTFPTFGFLSTTLALLLVAAAAYFVPGGRTDLTRIDATVRWLVGAVLVYAAGSSWVPLVPLAGIALAVWYASLVLPALWTGPWPRVRLALGLGVPTLAMGVALLNQYRDVIGPIGGSNALLQAGGGTPSASEVMIAAALGLVGFGWVATMPMVAGESRVLRRGPSFTAPLLWVAVYLVAIMGGDGWVSKLPPQYGAVKLLYVVVGLVLLLGLADLLASPVVLGRPLTVAAALVIAALFAVTTDQGPLYTAAVTHWPAAVPVPNWVQPVTDAVASGHRVLCLGTTPARDTSGPNVNAYTCSRFASSLQGRDDKVALDWRFVQLNRTPVATAAAELRAAKDRPWTVIVLGSTASLHDKKAWWAPLVAQGGLTFVKT